MMLDFGFETLGLERITAPISPENLAASHGAASFAFVCEARMAEYLDVGGRRKDHALWAVTRDAIPPNGFAHNWIKRFESTHRCPSPDTTPEKPEPRSPVDCSGFRQTRALLIATGRYHAGKLRHQFDWLGVGRPVALAHSGPPAVVLHTPETLRLCSVARGSPATGHPFGPVSRSRAGAMGKSTHAGPMVSGVHARAPRVPGGGRTQARD